mmetsp:Transcript_18370/g.27609  ORF Transcript_18370/g.27609 Transcript_18370/m.27609 type:complete len:211 (-) Transcript_18370:27-659(-)
MHAMEVVASQRQVAWAKGSGSRPHLRVLHLQPLLPHRSAPQLEVVQIPVGRLGTPKAHLQPRHCGGPRTVRLLHLAMRSLCASVAGEDLQQQPDGAPPQHAEQSELFLALRHLEAQKRRPVPSDPRRASGSAVRSVIFQLAEEEKEGEEQQPRHLNGNSTMLRRPYAPVSRLRVSPESVRVPVLCLPSHAPPVSNHLVICMCRAPLAWFR